MNNLFNQYKHVHYAYLSGEHEEIPLGELKAVLEAENTLYNTIFIDEQLYLFTSPNINYQRIINRVAYTKELGLVLAYTHDITLESILELLDHAEWDFLQGKRFIVKAKHIRGFYSKDIPTPIVERAIGKKILEIIQYKAKVTPTTPEIIIRVLFSRSIVVIGIIRSKLDTKYFLRMRPRKRPFFHPGVLEPKISRAFVNFSRIRRDETFLDPFCGTGGFLIEACNIGAYTIGYDIRKLMSYGSLQNILYYNLSDRAIILQADATHMPIKDESIDAIGTDPPYGRASSTHGRSLKELIRMFLEESSRVMKKHRYVCFATPHTIDPLEYIEMYGFKLIERYTMKVHRGLTRVIYIIKKEK